MWSEQLVYVFIVSWSWVRGVNHGNGHSRVEGRNTGLARLRFFLLFLICCGFFLSHTRGGFSPFYHPFTPHDFMKLGENNMGEKGV
jgi:hypothetical protein